MLRKGIAEKRKAALMVFSYEFEDGSEVNLNLSTWLEEAGKGYRVRHCFTCYLKGGPGGGAKVDLPDTALGLAALEAGENPIFANMDAFADMAAQMRAQCPALFAEWERSKIEGKSLKGSFNGGSISMAL